jgi:hypothetical protein
MKIKTKIQFFSITAVLFFFAGTITTQFALANNHSDTSYYIKYNGDGSDLSITPRRKYDTTPVYVKNKGKKAQRTSIGGTNSVT